MKKILAVASATLMLSSIAGVSAAHHSQDHEANTHGMCTAYFSGSENGQQNKRDNGNAFTVWETTVEALENGGDLDGDGDFDAYDIAQYCNDVTGGFGNPGGGNSAWFDPESDDCPEDDPATTEDESAQCEALNDQEGGTNPGDNNSNSGNNGNGGGDS